MGTAGRTVLTGGWMGWHSDDEPELGAAPVIASVSLGATRRFVLKHRYDSGQRVTLDLPHGSLLVMASGTRRLYPHALPRTAWPVDERLSLTFRFVLLGAAGSSLVAANCRDRLHPTQRWRAQRLTRPAMQAERWG